jgi:hypothetical protein
MLLKNKRDKTEKCLKEEKEQGLIHLKSLLNN